MAYSVAKALDADTHQPSQLLTNIPLSTGAEQCVTTTSSWEGMQRFLWGPVTASRPMPSPAAPIIPTLVMHVCGKFHMEQGLGIPEHLSVYAPHARVLTVVSVPGDVAAWRAGGGQAPDIDSSLDVCGTGYSLEELRGLADYVVVSNAALPRSFSIDHPV